MKSIMNAFEKEIDLFFSFCPNETIEDPLFKH